MFSEYVHITSDQAYLFSHLLANSGRLFYDYTVEFIPVEDAFK